MGSGYITMKIKRKWLFWICIFLIIMLLTGITGYAMLIAQRDIGVNWTHEDYKTGLQKLSSLTNDDESFDKGKSSGLLEINLTDKELSSILTETGIMSVITQNFIPTFKYINVKFLGNNEAEAVFMLEPRKVIGTSSLVQDTPKQYTKYFMDMATKVQIYTKIKFEKISSNEIHINIKNIDLGHVPIPKSMLKAAEKTINRMINDYISRKNIIIEQLLLSKNMVYYKGTISYEILNKLKYYNTQIQNFNE